MADALLSPAVGGAMLCLSAGAIALAARRLGRAPEDHRPPLMGVLGAFVFAAQMINFTIPGTGSSGHLAGALLLAIVLGADAAFLAITSVLIIQALFFADGGLLALGCNIFNIGFIGCYIAYPLIYRPIAGAAPNRRRIFAGSLIAAVAALQLGALAVVLQTTLSGVSALPFTTFFLLMQPIHLAIGTVEGLATAAVVLFLAQARPELLLPTRGLSLRPFTRVAAAFAFLAVLTAGVLSSFASSNPDGLEWSVQRAAGEHEIAQPHSNIHAALAAAQQSIAPLPDYDFTNPSHDEPKIIHAGTSVAGLLGSMLTLGFAGCLGLALRRRPARA